MEAAIVARSSVRWGGIFAGVFTAILAYLTLMALGLAVAGSSIRGAIVEDGDLGGLGVGTAVWVVLATLIALFVGGYATGRVSGLIATRVARIEGLVVASLFFVFMTMQVGSLVGMIGSGMGRLAGAAGRAAPDIAGNEQVQQVVQGALSDLNLRSPPTEVAQGVASRLLSGDSEGATTYLASEAGISEQEARRRIESFRSQAESKLTEAGATAAQVVQAAGWTLFLTFLLGGAAAVIGGQVGARRTLENPIEDRDEVRIRERAA